MNLDLDTLVLEQNEQIGGQLHTIYGPIENYPGVHAEQWARVFRALFSGRLADAEFDLWTSVEIENVDSESKTEFACVSGEELQSISIIIATGVRRRQLGIPGEDEFAGHGIIESATRDREAFAGKDVCVIGGGDAAAENALLAGRGLSYRYAGSSPQEVYERGQHFAEQLQRHHCLTIFHRVCCDPDSGRPRKWKPWRYYVKTPCNLFRWRCREW